MMDENDPGEIPNDPGELFVSDRRDVWPAPHPTSYRWAQAAIPDAPALVALILQHFAGETVVFFTPDAARRLVMEGLDTIDAIATGAERTGLYVPETGLD